MAKTMNELAAEVSAEEKAAVAEAVKPALARSMFSGLIPMSELLGEDGRKGFCQLVAYIHTDKDGELIDAWLSREMRADGRDREH